MNNRLILIAYYKESLEKIAIFGIANITLNYTTKQALPVKTLLNVSRQLVLSWH